MNYDAIVIGAGPAGATAALLLARAGWRVAIVEKSAFPRRKVCGEFISAPVLELLARLGVADPVMRHAGPEVHEVAIYAGTRGVVGEMPAYAVQVSTSPRYAQHERVLEYGRALGREHLDARLLAAARGAGADVWQPWRVESHQRDAGGFLVRVRHGLAAAAVLPPRDDEDASLRGAARRSNPDTIDLRAPILIAAHGSWDTGRLSVPGRASDFVAFKAHFRECELPPHRMPLVAFHGGYAGLVTTDDRRASFACCITRDALGQVRAKSAAASAGEAVFRSVLEATPAFRAAIGAGVREGAWLAAGALRPGEHGRCGEGLFTIGNAHAEAHPIVGEGIAMAIESACLLCERLVGADGRDRQALDVIARDYERAHRTIFRPRIRAAAAFAAIASRPAVAGAAVSVFAKLPPLFTFCARKAGKTTTFRRDLSALQVASSSR